MSFIDIQPKSVSEITAILQMFGPISLSEMDDVELLNRVDTKYMFHQIYLEDILNQINTEYKVLTIDGLRFSRYETRYFDTPGLEMYTRHHNGKLNRQKVRFRSYVDSGCSFFEVKSKTNKGRTIKDRIKQQNPDFIIEGATELMLKKHTGYNAAMLCKAIQVNYNRITLAGNNLSERLTIDFGVTFLFKNKVKTFPGLVIAEVKQDTSSKSPFITLMHANGIHPHSLSKYCLGIACMNSHVKSNNFKHKLIHINKLCHENS
jgi:hypothetical protein